jgi:serine O-acetyltransferase
MDSVFRKDVEAFFGTSAAEEEFGGRPQGLRLFRNTAVQLVLNPGLLAVGLYRLSRWFHVRKMDLPSKLIDRFNEMVCGIQLPGGADFGPGLEVQHPQGIVISVITKAGKNCTVLGAGVTTGIRDLVNDPYSQTVTLGDNVTIATGAKLLGPIVIGDNVNIGPNVVVMEDVPDDATVIVAERPRVIEKKKTTKLRRAA